MCDFGSDRHAIVARATYRATVDGDHAIDQWAPHTDGLVQGERRLHVHDQRTDVPRQAP